MGLAELELHPPRSMNAAPAAGTRGARMARHKAKKALENELAILLLAAGVPRPIPGLRVHATAELAFPTVRERDEGNYRTALEKSLGDALAPHDPEAPFRWLPRDTPEFFTFGAVTFTVARGKPPLATIRLAWADELAALLEDEARRLRAELGPEQTHGAGREGEVR